MKINLRYIEQKRKPREVLKISEKYCSKCEETKEVSEFSKNKRLKDGFAHYCKECRKGVNAKYYVNNKFK